MKKAHDDMPQEPLEEAANENIYEENADSGIISPADANPLAAEAHPLEIENRELRDQLLRSLAEAENTRRRASLDVEEARKFAISKFAGDIIGVLENLYRAEESVGANADQPMVKALLEGVQMTRASMQKTLENHGIMRIFPLDSAFDHQYHQAVVEVPSTGKEKGTVVQVMQAGYLLKDRLLRPALVAVAQ